MLASASPPKFPLAFAQNAGAPFVRPIPVASQIGISAGAASLNDGFVPLNATQIAAGGIPPFEQDMNGILRQITQGVQWQQAGGPLLYDADFATGIGGYPQYASVMSAVVPGNYWMSIADNNLTDPDSSSSANWVPHPSMAKTGDFGWTPTSVVPFGWTPANFNSLGNAASGANLANPMTRFLWMWHWNSFSNTVCPVSGGRGANALADYNANKTIATFDMRGTGQGGVDTMGGGATTRLTGVPIVSGSAIIPGSILGENLHALLLAELAAHNHQVTTNTGLQSNPHTHGVGIVTGFESTVHSHTVDPINTINGSPSAYTGGGTGGLIQPGTSGQSVNHTHTVSGNTTTESADHFHTVNVFSASVGSGTAHNTYERNALGLWLLKL